MPWWNLGKYWTEVKSDAALNEVIELLDAALTNIPKSQLNLQIELALARDEFLHLAGREREIGPRSVVALTPLTANALSNLLDALPGSPSAQVAGSPDRGHESRIGLRSS